MNKLYCLIILFLTCQASYSQNLVLNGNFEINTAGSCNFNLPNGTFNSYVPNCFAFGKNSEIDIQDSSCTWSPYLGNMPAKGNWFISLATNSFSFSPDGLSLFLNSALIAGNVYQISYFEKSDTTFLTHTNDSLLIGISSDSSVFGVQIFSSLPASQQGWLFKSFTFTAPITGKYLTFTNAGVQQGWNFIDDVSLTFFTGVNQLNENAFINIFPNPLTDKLRITTNKSELSEIILYDIASRQLLQQKFTHSVSLNTEQLEKGIYLYEVRNKNGVLKKGKVVKE